MPKKATSSQYMKWQPHQKPLIAVGTFCLGLLLPIVAIWLSPSSTPTVPVERKEETSDETPGATSISKIGDLTWIGHFVPANNSIGGTQEYELVQLDAEGKETVVETFPYGMCDEMQWNTFSDGRFKFTYSTSPCEAFVETTGIAFNETGKAMVRTHYRSDSGIVAVEKPGSTAYTVKPVTSEPCTDDSATRDGNEFIPAERTLLGVTITSDQGSKTYNLPKPQMISCGVGYGESIIEPYVSEVQTETGGVAFELPGGTRVWVSINETSGAARVEFY